MNDNVLIENAILAFLHNYPDHKWRGEYQLLLGKVRALNEQPETAEVRKRGRPAKRQRKKETTSDTTSKEEIKAT